MLSSSWGKETELSTGLNMGNPRRDRVKTFNVSTFGGGFNRCATVHPLYKNLAAKVLWQSGLSSIMEKECLLCLLTRWRSVVFMADEIAVDSFLNLLGQSELVSDDQLVSLLAEFRGQSCAVE